LLLLALAGPAALLAAAFALRSHGGTGFDDLTREWSAAWHMIRDHFWLGVGPGNYGPLYPKYMAPSAPTFARQPDSFFLEVWATLGLPALLALGLALVSFFRRTLALVPDPGLAVENEDGRTRWEFYEGAMIGLVAGFLLRALPAGPGAIVSEAVDAAVRAVVWFAVFALIEGIRWTGATRVLACTAGAAALLLHLSVSGGFFVPGLSQPLFLLAALALNGLPEQPKPLGRQYVGRILPLALATGAVLMLAMQLFFPVTSAAADNTAALASGQKYLDVRSGVTRSLGEGMTERLRNRGEVLKNIVGQLSQAVETDPGNARYWVDLANWYGTLYDETNPPNDDYRARGLKYALTAQQLDPHGEAGYLAEARLHQLGARRATTDDRRMASVANAPGPLFKLLDTRRYDVQLHYRLAVLLMGGGDLTGGRNYAASALKLDQLAPTPERRLSDPQREQARRFAEAP
jgi:hypothetical protein